MNLYDQQTTKQPCTDCSNISICTIDIQLKGARESAYLHQVKWLNITTNITTTPTTKQGEEGRAALRREEKKQPALLLVLLVQWRHCYYESSCTRTNTERQTERPIS